MERRKQAAAGSGGESLASSEMADPQLFASAALSSSSSSSLSAAASSSSNPIQLSNMGILDQLEAAFEAASSQRLSGAARHTKEQRALLATVFGLLKSSIFLEARRRCQAAGPDAPSRQPVDRALAESLQGLEASVAERGRRAVALRKQLRGAVPARVQTRLRKRLGALSSSEQLPSSAAAASSSSSLAAMLSPFSSAAAAAAAEEATGADGATGGRTQGGGRGGKRRRTMIVAGEGDAAEGGRPRESSSSPSSSAAAGAATLAAPTAEEDAATFLNVRQGIAMLREASEDVALSLADQTGHLASALRDAEDAATVLELQRKGPSAIDEILSAPPGAVAAPAGRGAARNYPPRAAAGVPPR